MLCPAELRAQRETQHSIAALPLTLFEPLRIVRPPLANEDKGRASKPQRSEPGGEQGSANQNMFRTPFVWEVQVRREVLDEEIVRLRELPYLLWQQVLSRPMTKIARGRDNRNYYLRTTARRVHEGAGDIRVTVALRTGTLRRHLMRQSFTITPDNRLTD